MVVHPFDNRASATLFGRLFRTGTVAGQPAPVRYSPVAAETENRFAPFRYIAGQFPRAGIVDHAHCGTGEVDPYAACRSAFIPHWVYRFRAADVKSGVAAGIVNGIDIVNHCYLVELHNTTRLVPDIDVLSSQPQPSVPIAAFKIDHKSSRHAVSLAGGRGSGPKSLSKMQPTEGNDTDSCRLCADDDLSGLIAGEVLPQGHISHFGGYPMKFLVVLARLAKLLIVKNNLIGDLRASNDAAQWMVSVKDPVTPLFQHNYAHCVTSLEKINYQIDQYMVHVIQFANEIALEKGFDTLEQPHDISTKCDAIAMDMILKNRNNEKKLSMTSSQVAFIQKVASSLIQMHILSDQVDCSYDFTSTRNTVAQLLDKVSPNNRQFFIDHCQVPLNTILTDLDRRSNLSLFHYENPLLSDD